MPATVDQTLTGMGGRLLRQRLLRPSMQRDEIEQRLDAPGELLQQTILRAELRKQLGGILDLERLLAKVTLGSAGPRDVLALGRSLEKVPALKRCFDTQQAARLQSLHGRLDELPDVATEDFTLVTMQERFAELGDVQAGIDDVVCDLGVLLEWVEREEAAGEGEAPYPPNFPKMPGEPRRVQPSRARGND